MFFILNLLLFVPAFAQDVSIFDYSEDDEYPAKIEYPTEVRLGSKSGINKDHTIRSFADIMLPVYRHRAPVLDGKKDLLLFLNPKVILSDSSTNEENIGIGLRYISYREWEDKGFILGANFFFDTASSKLDYRYNQIGFGGEFLSKWLDLRGNYYCPVSKNNSKGYYTFGERSLMSYFTYEEALPGFDLEAGTLVPFISDFVETRVYGGGYWYNSDLGEDVEGSKARIEMRPSQALTFTAELKDDSVFGTNTFVGGYITLPFDIYNLSQGKNPFEGWKDYLRLGKGPRKLPQRMTEPVIRDIDIATRAIENKPTKIHDVMFVDNSNAADPSEDGSLSHPHDTISEAFADPLCVDGTWVYVRKGLTNYAQSLLLPDNITLWGEGYKYLGLGGSAYPVIDGGGAERVITLGLNDRIMGLQIQNGDRGIYGQNFGTVEILGNNITINGIGVSLISDGTNSASANISGNTINKINEAVQNGVELHSADSSDLSCILSGNTINGLSGIGVSIVTDDSSTCSAAFRENTISGNTSDGIYLHSNFSSVISVSLVRNMIMENTLDGLELDAVGTSTITLDAGNASLGSNGYNSIYNNARYNINNQATADATVTVKAENNWWGQSPPDAGKFHGYVDYDPWLPSNPNL